MQPFGEPHERERCGREEAHEEKRGEILKGTPSFVVLFSPPPLGASLYRGMGADLPLHQVSPGPATKGGMGKP
jgi:hypothetical protein